MKITRMTVVKTSKATAQIYVTQMLATVPVPKKVWVFGDQISGTFKINSILHAGQRTRALTLGLPEDPGQFQMFRDSWQVWSVLANTSQIILKV